MSENAALNNELYALRREVNALGCDINALRNVISQGVSPVVTAELVTMEDPTPAKLDELIAAQKRTNELLEALLKLGMRVTQDGAAMLTAVT